MYIKRISSKMIKNFCEKLLAYYVVSINVSLIDLYEITLIEQSIAMMIIIFTFPRIRKKLFDEEK